MQLVSAQFLQAIRRPHVAVFFVDVWLNGTNVTPTQFFQRGLRLTGGSVTVDATSQIRRTCTLSIADPALEPSTAQDLLAPYGTELRVQRGIQYPDGSTEFVQLGWFRVDDASITISGESGPTEVTVNGSDRFGYVVDDRFFYPTPSAQTTVVGEIQNHLLDDMPSWIPALQNQTTDATACPKLTFDDKDRAAAVNSVAAAISAECFFSADGVPILRKIPQVNPTGFVWTVDAGAGGAMTSITPEVSRQNIYNAVVATGETTDGSSSSFFAVARDQNPSSATRWDGPFGHKVVFYTSPILSSNAACLAAAQSRLSQYTGAGWNITVESLVNPALDAGDTIKVVFPDGRIQYHIIDGLTIPLDTTTPLSITTRSNDPEGDVDAGA